MNTKITKDINCNAILELANGETIEIFADNLVQKNLNHFKGWQCNAGVERIYIESDFTVYSGQCKNNILGNLFDENFSLIEDYVLCEQNSCDCAGDIYTTKAVNL